MDFLGIYKVVSEKTKLTGVKLLKVFCWAEK